MIQETIKLYGLFGDPVGHSLSPFFQNEAFKTLGINAVYFPFTVKAEDLAGAVAAIRHLNMGGVNLTIPHKEAVIPLLDKVKRDAVLSGSVNTIVNRNGELTGYSTDGEGFLLSLQQEAGFDPRGKTCVLGSRGGSPGGCFSPSPGRAGRPLPGEQGCRKGGGFTGRPPETPGFSSGIRCFPAGTGKGGSRSGFGD